MKILDFRSEKNIHEDRIEDYIYTLYDKSFIVIENDLSDDNLDINLDIALSLINATTILQKINRTLANLELPNEMDQNILFEVLTSVLRADNVTVEQLKRYFKLIADVEAYADKFNYLNADNPIEINYDVDLYLVGMQHLLQSERYADKLENFFNLRYLLISNEIDYSEFMKSLRELI